MISTQATGVVLLIARILLLAAVIPLLKAMNRNANYLAVTFWFTFLSGILALPFVIFQYSITPAYFAGASTWLDNAALSAICFTMGMVAFMWALNRGEASLLAPLLALGMVFIYVLDLLRGAADISMAVVGGILLTSAGVTLLNVKPGVKLSTMLNPFAVLLQAGAAGAVFYAFTLALNRIIDSQGVATAPKFAYSVVANWFVALLCLALIVLRRNWSTLKETWNYRRGLLIIFSVLGVVNYTSLLFLYDHYNPSLIEPVSQVSIILVVFYGTLVLKEPLYLRWLAAILIAAGASIVYLASKAPEVLTLPKG